MDTAVTMDIDALDLSALSTDASQFFSTPGFPSDAATEQFLSRYPLPVLFSALEAGEELESLLISTLEKVFNTQFGAIALLQSLPYARSGLEANSPSTRRMTCLGVSKLLERFGDNEVAVEALLANDLVLPVLKAITDGDANVASAAAEAVQNLAKTSLGIDLLFTGKGTAAGHLMELALHGSSLVRIRIFSVIAFLFKHSKQAVPAVKESGILRVLELELSSGSDVLAQMNALELLHEIAVTPDGARFLTDGGLLQQLVSIMGSNRVDALVRSQSIMIGARLISPEGPLPSLVSKEDGLKIVEIIDTFLRTFEGSESREKEAAIDALGRIGMSKLGAELLFQSSPPVAQHIVQVAFTRKGGSEQLVGIHALASVAGSERTEGPILSEQAEVSFKDLIFTELELLSKWSLSDLVHWLLEQAYEMRLAAYRLIVPLAARSWFLLNICSNKDIVNFLTDPHVEQAKEGMEWRHSCCVAISSSLGTSGHRIDSSLHEVLEKFQAAVIRGPYFTREKPEAQPLVVTQERF